MQRLSDFTTAKIDRNRKERAARIARDRVWLEDTEANDADLCALPAAAVNRDSARQLLWEGTASRLGLACDDCGTELLNCGLAEPLTNPHERRVICPHCGWSGSMHF